MTIQSRSLLQTKEKSPKNIDTAPQIAAKIGNNIRMRTIAKHDNLLLYQTEVIARLQFHFFDRRQFAGPEK